MHVLPNNPLLYYNGRIDFSDEMAPVMVYPGSFVKLRFYGTSIRMNFVSLHNELNNYIGVIIDGKMDKMLLPTDGEEHTLTIASALKENIHEICIFKRMCASAHYFILKSFDLSENAGLLAVEKKPDRRIEVFGDSISAGEISEAEKYAGKMDPENYGEYNNSFFSYAAYLGRKLNASVHNISQGGVAMLKGDGAREYTIADMFDCIQHEPALGPIKKWDFKNYIPQLVLVAIGQNDSYPEDYMAKDFDSERSKEFRLQYEDFVRRIRKEYPKATIICKTSTMCHDLSWDRAIGNVVKKIDDNRIHHFMYKNNGCLTPGHVRGSEAEKMAEELYEFIDSLGYDVWKEEDN